MHTPSPIPPPDPAFSEGEIPEGLTAAQVAAEYRRRELIAVAAASPLPGPMLEAFRNQPVEVAGIKLRPLVARDIATLKELGSPFIEHLLELSRPVDQRKETPWTDEQAFESIYLFTVPSKVAVQLIRTGRAAYNAAAADLCGDLTVAALVELTQAVTALILASFATSVNYAPVKSGNTETFTPPPPRPATASGGGSNTLAA